MKKLTRLEGNKEVRRVLNRHGVDLAYCQYSVAGTDIRLTGHLCRSSGGDFQAAHLEHMIQDLIRQLHGYTITGDMDNWSFSSDHITHLGQKDRSLDSLGVGEFEDDYDLEAG